MWCGFVFGFRSRAEAEAFVHDSGIGERTAMDACLEARQGWEDAGRPGPDPQAPLFPEWLYEQPEVVSAIELDRRRR